MLIFSKYHKGIILSQVAFAFNAFIGLFSYRYIWNNVESDLFTIWIAIFEMSQFFLLFDLGFSQAFIKKNGKQGSSYNSNGIASGQLRSQLLLSGLFAGFLTIIAAYFLITEKINFTPFLILSLSVFFTLLTYAETAILRLQKKFTDVYLGSFVGGIFFMSSILVLDLIKIDPLYVIALSNLTRVIVIYIYQLLVMRVIPFFSKIDIESLDYHIVLINVSYFSLIMIDIFLLKSFHVSVLIIAQLAANKKLFDLGRGFVDSGLQVLSVKYATSANNSKKEFLFFCGIVIVLYFCMFIMSIWFLNIWLDGYKFSLKLSFVLCISMCTISIFRILSLKSYYSSGRVFNLISTAVIAKLVFIYFIYFDNDVIFAYSMQSIVLAILVCLFIRGLKNGR